MTGPTPPEFRATAPIPDGTVLLEASAGTGKTHTITSLVLRLVTERPSAGAERIPLDRILVVTFTRAAAAELRGRVRARLGSAADAFDHELLDPVDLDELEARDEVVAHLIREGRVLGRRELEERSRALRVARERFDEATIDTIHGFCQRTLRSAAPDVDLDLGAELTEDVVELVDELVHDHLASELRTADDGYYQLLRSEGVGRDRLLRIARTIEAEPGLRVLPDLDHLADPPQEWERRIQRFRATWQAQGAELLDWLHARAAEKAFDGNRYNKTTPGKHRDAIDAWCADEPAPIGDLDHGLAKILGYLCRRSIDKALREPGSLPPHLDVVDAAEELLDAPRLLAAAFLVRFARHARDELARRKAARGLMSFTDLLATLDAALADETTRDAVRTGIRERFDVALIDEFQDTDPIQWRIFDAAFGEDARLHLIGDPKQAIYGFRGADVQTYLAAARTVDDDARFTLATNWRSDQRYLDALQTLFGRDEAFGPHGVFARQGIEHVEVRAAAEHREDRLHADRGTLPALEVRYVPRELAVEDAGVDGPELPKVITKGWAGVHLPRHVASEIVGFLSGGVTIDVEGGTRPVVPRDIAVLVRTNQQARQVQSALQDAGVPAVVGSDQSVLDAPEALAVQRLLDALLQPGSDRLVRPALAGPLLACPASDLAAPDERAWDEWLTQFEGWAQVWRDRGVASLLRTVLADTGAVPRLLGRVRGERMVTNLLHLGELLHAAESGARLGPEGLAAWLREQRGSERPSVDGLELRLESDADAVTVVTVHRSKGLQYPVVWCPFLWDGTLLRRDEHHVLRFHHPDDDALSLDLDPAKDLPPKSRYLAVAAKERWEENLRLLYVAVTRAQHRCVVHTGPFRDVGSSPLQRVLHGADFTDGVGPSGPPDPVGRADDELLRDLRSLEDDAFGVSEVAPLAAPVRWQPVDETPTALRVRTFDRGVDRSWQRTSFSRLTRAEHPGDGGPDDEGLDHDQAVEEPVPTDGAASAHGRQPGGPLGVTIPSPDDDAPQVPLAGFPRGADPGTFLHHVLEELDFTRAEDGSHVIPIIESRLRRAGLGQVDLPSLLDGLGAVIGTPLGPLVGDRTLGSLGRSDRSDELEFDLPLSGGYEVRGHPLTLGRLAGVFSRHAVWSDAPLAPFAQRLRVRDDLPARGFLTGSIDLVARVDGRYVVADYKSNWLGSVGPDGERRSTVGHYHPSRLAREMVSHDYVLQYHLYLVALHRLLRWRLGAAYDYDEHVAGVVYLFLRGMTGPGTPRDASGTPYGVFADRPSRALIEDLDAVLRGEST